MLIFATFYARESKLHNIHDAILNAVSNILCFHNVYVCVCELTSVISDSATLWTIARQDPLSMGNLQAKIPEWVAMPSSRGPSPPRGSNLGLLWLLHCRQILYHWAAGEAHAFHKTISVVIWNPSFSIFLINSYEIFWIHLTFTRTCIHDLIFISLSLSMPTERHHPSLSVSA